MSEEKQDPYDGLSPYGIAVTALERILELDAGWMSWDEARAIASEAHGLAVAVGAHAAEKAGGTPGLQDLIADWRRTADVLKDRHGVGDARERNTLEVVIGQAEAILIEPQPAPELAAAMAALEDIARAAQGSIDASLPTDHDWFVSRAMEGLGWLPGGWPKAERPAPERADVLSKRFFHLASELENEAAANGCFCESKTLLDAAARIRRALDTDQP